VDIWIIEIHKEIHKDCGYLEHRITPTYTVLFKLRNLEWNIFSYYSLKVAWWLVPN